jgi:cytoskeletal protein CcmA (bactofilin family)
MNEKSNQKGNGTKTIIGETIVFSGEISGSEDVTINGSLEGEVNFREHNIFIGETGRVNANVEAKNISIEGDVKGELRASEQVSIKPSGRVNGDIRAPRVVLDDGCQFKGSVDMDDKHVADTRHAKLQLAGGKSAPTHPIKAGKKPVKS